MNIRLSEEKKRGRRKANNEPKNERKSDILGEGRCPKLRVGILLSTMHVCHANLLTNDDLTLNHAKCYENPVKVAQDQHILTLLDVSKPNRKRGRVDMLFLKAEQDRQNIVMERMNVMMAMVQSQKEMDERLSV